MTACVLALVLLGQVTAVGLTASSGRVWSVRGLVQFHQQEKGNVQVQDVYKLLYQANLGVEHILGDSAAVTRDLLEELASLDSASRGEELVERISTDDEIVRVNLRPFKVLNISPSLLVDCLWRSARETHPDTTAFLRQWKEFQNLVKERQLSFSPSDAEHWAEMIHRQGIRAIHHSAAYSSANHPAYRVVRRKVFEGVMRTANWGTR
jgi:hypothetical protein